MAWASDSRGRERAAGEPVALPPSMRDRVPFLLYRAAEESHALANQMLAGMALSARQAGILTMVTELQPMTQKALGDALRIDRTTITDQRDFYHALSSDQLATALHGGLPFTRLRPDQQALWLKINVTYNYAHPLLNADRAAQVFATWKQNLLRWEDSPRFGRRLWHRYPDPDNPSRMIGGSLSTVVRMR